MAVWQEVPLSRPEDYEALRAESRAAFESLDLNHDVTWLADSAARDCSIVVLAARREGRLVGLAPFEVHPSSLKFGLGDLAIARKRVQRFTLERSPLVSHDAGPDVLSACFDGLVKRLPSNGAVFLRGVPEGSDMHGLLTERHSPVRSAFHVLPHGPTYTRCRISWNGSFDTYLSTLSKVSRKDLRRTLTKAEQASPAWRLERYCGVEDVVPYLEAAGEVSAKTYQHRLLGEGVFNNDYHRTNLLMAARKGQFLGHVLFAGDQPAAFHLGYIAGSSFCMVNGGYDPAWAKSQVGILTFLMMLQDLERHRVPVTLLDYLYGGGAYKERTSNVKTQERHYYLIKRDFSGSALAVTMRTADAVSRSLGGFLERFQLKGFIKRHIRRIHAWRPANYKTFPFDIVPLTTATSPLLPLL